MPLPPSGIVTVRLAPADADDIDALVAAGRFTSRSDFLRHAVRVAIEAARARSALESAAPAPPAAPASGEDAEPLAGLEGPGALGRADGARSRRSTPKRGIH